MTKLSQVSDAIIADIESGVLREGDHLPSEEELAAVHGVSVGTVQKALARLASSGLISREHGRGTFVTGTSVAPADVRYLRFSDDEGKELPSYVHVRSVKRMKRKGPWSDFLEGEAFVRIERSINVGGRFDLYSEFWLREEDFAQLGGVDRRRAREKPARAFGSAALVAHVARGPVDSIWPLACVRRAGARDSTRRARLHHGAARLHAS